MRSFKLSPLVVASLALISAAATAGPVVDQSQSAFNLGLPFAFGAQPNLPVGQTFTAGLSGKLSGISVVGNGGIYDANFTTPMTAVFDLEVRQGQGTGGTLLGSLQATLGCGNAFVGNGYCGLNFDLASLGIDVQAGQKYTFDFTSVKAPGNFAQRGLLANASNPYAGGQAVAGPGYGNQPNWDLVFQTQVTATVPEPESLALVGVAFAALGLAAVRRRRPQR